MGDVQRGDVVLVRFPFTDLHATKLRPAVILAVHGEDVVAVGIFSTLPDVLKDTWLLLEAHHPHFPQTGLKKRSVVKAEKVAIAPSLDCPLHDWVVPSVPDERLGSADQAGAPLTLRTSVTFILPLMKSPPGS